MVFSSYQSRKLVLFLVDVAIFAVIAVFIGFFLSDRYNLAVQSYVVQFVLSLFCLFTMRLLCGVYRSVLRYGDAECFAKFLLADGIALIFNIILEKYLPIPHVSYAHLVVFICLTSYWSQVVRLLYQYSFSNRDNKSLLGKLLNKASYLCSGDAKAENQVPKTPVAIIGAGRVAVSLVNELLNNPFTPYAPTCFVDLKNSRAGRRIFGLPVLPDEDASLARIKALNTYEVILAKAQLEDEQRKELYQRFLNAGFKLKTYSAPLIENVGDKPAIKQVAVEDVLFRKPIEMKDQKSDVYYKDKVVLITGGGGSIGSELCRQLAKKGPKQIIVLDIYENGAYDVQQELKFAYGSSLNLRVEIASINNERSMRRVFEEYRPQIVINAAAHKHVPLMETNCIEAIENNVIGTKVLIELCEEYNVERFMMVSTDKAVNPTNVMGATKRMCELMTLSASAYGKVKYSVTRFGNVLGSAGSVVPLFKRQIENGGPITITDKRIIRYFMTIPEAAQLVLLSGALASNGELFVLDMGQPVKIYDLAQTLIRLSGATGIKIVETGLRPGEKLYEELLVKTEELDKTENDLIFIERDKPLPREVVEEKFRILQEACLTESDDAAREALHKVIDTFRSPEKVNQDAEKKHILRDMTRSDGAKS